MGIQLNTCKSKCTMQAGTGRITCVETWHWPRLTAGGLIDVSPQRGESILASAQRCGGINIETWPCLVSTAMFIAALDCIVPRPYARTA